MWMAWVRIVLLSLFYQNCNWGTERLKDLLKVIELTSGKCRVQILRVWLHGQCLRWQYTLFSHKMAQWRAPYTCQLTLSSHQLLREVLSLCPFNGCRDQGTQVLSGNNVYRKTQRKSNLKAFTMPQVGKTENKSMDNYKVSQELNRMKTMWHGTLGLECHCGARGRTLRTLRQNERLREGREASWRRWYDLTWRQFGEWMRSD